MGIKELVDEMEDEMEEEHDETYYYTTGVVKSIADNIVLDGVESINMRQGSYEIIAETTKDGYWISVEKWNEGKEE